MNKKAKLITITSTAMFMVVTWGLIFFSHTVDKQINYYWQVAMGAAAMLFAILGLMSAAKWNWLKSGVGRGVFFISMALVMWSIGQMGWSYFLFVDPKVQSPPSHLLDIVDFSAIPLWFIGILMLSKATGARYGLKKRSGQIIVALIATIMVVFSYYMLVDVARGGAAYFAQPFWKSFFDLGYSVGDAITATIAIAIYVLSWKLLGGRFKLPILIILSGFILLYFADFTFSYLDGRNEYYNGDVADLLYMLMLTAFGFGLGMLDPTHVRNTSANTVSPNSVMPQPAALPQTQTPLQNTPSPANVAQVTPSESNIVLNSLQTPNSLPPTNLAASPETTLPNPAQQPAAINTANTSNSSPLPTAPSPPPLAPPTVPQAVENPYQPAPQPNMPGSQVGLETTTDPTNTQQKEVM